MTLLLVSVPLPDWTIADYPLQPLPDWTIAEYPLQERSLHEASIETDQVEGLLVFVQTNSQVLPASCVECRNMVF